MDKKENTKSALLSYEDRKKQTYISIGIVILVLVLGICCFAIFSSHGKEEEPPASSFPESMVTPAPAASEVEEVIPTMQLLESKEPTLQSKAFQPAVNADIEQMAKEYCTEENKVEGITTLCGNPVYKVPPEFAYINDESADYQSEDETYVQLFGCQPIPVYKNGWTSNDIFARKEWTGERIYLFDNKAEEQMFLDAWNAGQKVLADPQSVDKGTIVFNGRLVTGFKFLSENNEYFIPLYGIAGLDIPKSFHDDGNNKALFFSTTVGNEVESLRIPYVGENMVQNIQIPTFSYSHYGEGESDFWKDEFSVGVGTNVFVPASELSRYTGWHIYTDGNVISIVTDELDVTNLTHVYDASETNMPVEMQKENGNIIDKVMGAQEQIEDDPIE